MRRRAWLLPLLAACIAYAPVPWSGLVWDDPIVIGLQLAQFGEPSDLLRPPADLSQWVYWYYRPVVVASYLLDARLFGPGSAAGVHIANLVYHLAATFFVWLLARRLLAHLAHGPLAALVAATVFAVHPIHTESVSWMAGRSDVLATMLLLPALLLALRWRDERALGALLLVPLLLLLSLLAKEVAVAGFALLPMLVLLARPVAPAMGHFMPGWPARRLAMLGVPLALACGAVILAYLELRELAQVPPTDLQGLAREEMLRRGSAAVAFYLLKSFIPWPQANVVTWEMAPGPAGTPLILIVAVMLGVLAVRQWRRTAETVWLLPVGWFVVTLAVPAWIAIGPVSNTPLAERHAYLPSVAVALAAGLAFRAAWARGWQRPAVVVALLVIGVFTVGSISRSLVWSSSYALWSDGAPKARTNAMAWQNLALAQWDRGELDAALQSFVKATQDPELPLKVKADFYNVMGIIALEKGDAALAEQHFRASVGTDPQAVEALYQLAVLQVGQAERLRAAGRGAEADRRVEQGIGNLAQATTRFPRYHRARLTLVRALEEYGQALEQQGHREQALRRYQSALDQLAAMSRQLATVQDPQAARAKATTDAGVDPVELQQRIEAHVARLSAM